MKQSPQGPDVSVVLRATGSLKSDSANARTHSTKHVRQIAHSVVTFGWNVPIVIDSNLRVIAGNGRLAAAKLLGLSHVPTIMLEHLSDAQIRAFALADNRLGEKSKWNSQLLGQQLKALAAEELDFNLEATGFEIGEIELLIDGLDVAKDAGRDEEDEIPAGAAAVTKRGDLWRLGRNRIYCGSALEKDSYSTLLEDRLADLIFIDPFHDGRIAESPLHDVSECRELATASEATRFTPVLSQTFRLLAKHSASGTMHYVCGDWPHIPEIVEAANQIYCETVGVCVWNKEKAQAGSLYRSQHELIFVFRQGSVPPKKNKSVRNRTDVWSYPVAKSSVEKPVALIADAILDSSARGDVVLDSFLGTGTTLIAAERTSRICYGIEFDPARVDMAIRRWQAFTGSFAVHATSGRNFGELEQELCHGR